MPTGEKKNCGRIDKHLSHYWQGAKKHEWDETSVSARWIRPVYFCTGTVQTEGGHR